jgi:MYXO-CTERM domain-containing protein
MPTDSGIVDGGPRDAGTTMAVDTGVSSLDAGLRGDAGHTPGGSTNGSCGCSAPGTSSGSGGAGALGLLLAIATVARRRR